MRSMSAITGTGNPENGNYLAAWRETESLMFRTRRNKQNVDPRSFSTEQLEVLIVEIERNGDIKAGSVRDTKHKLYSSIIQERAWM